MIQNPTLTGKKLPELTNPATAEDIQAECEAIGADGTIITGSVKPYPPNRDFAIYPVLENVTLSREYDSPDVGYVLVISNITTEKYILDAKTTLRIPLRLFGDATASDVTSGKTFTSIKGFKITGTKT